MPLSKDKVIKQKEALTRVMNFEARPIQRIEGKSVEKVIDIQQKTSPSSGFVMDSLLSQKIKIADKRQEDLESVIEEQVIQRLKEMEEKVYKEAHAIGYDEGLEKGVYDNSELIQVRMTSLDGALTEISQLRQKLITENEAQILKMIFILAAKIAMYEINTNEQYILDLLRSLAVNIHEDMETTIYFSEEDHNFLKEADEKLKVDLEFLDKVRLEVDKSLSPGDCLIDTNYGQIDARLEQRINKMWSVIKDNLPRTKEPVEANMQDILSDEVKSDEVKSDEVKNDEDPMNQSLAAESEESSSDQEEESLENLDTESDDSADDGGEDNSENGEES